MSEGIEVRRECRRLEGHVGRGKKGKGKPHLVVGGEKAGLTRMWRHRDGKHERGRGTQRKKKKKKKKEGCLGRVVKVINQARERKGGGADWTWKV